MGDFTSGKVASVFAKATFGRTLVISKFKVQSTKEMVRVSRKMVVSFFILKKLGVYVFYLTFFGKERLFCLFCVWICSFLAAKKNQKTAGGDKPNGLFLLRYILRAGSPPDPGVISRNMSFVTQREMSLDIAKIY